MESFKLNSGFQPHSSKTLDLCAQTETGSAGFANCVKYSISLPTTDWKSSKTSRTVVATPVETFMIVGERYVQFLQQPVSAPLRDLSHLHSHGYTSHLS